MNVISLVKKIKRKFYPKKGYQSVRKKISEDNRIFEINARKPLLGMIDNLSEKYTPLSVVYCEIANFLVSCGCSDIARTYYELSLKKSLSSSVFSLYLQSLLLNPSCSDEELGVIASKYTELFFKNVKKYKHAVDCLDPNRRIKIGYLCHFFHNSVSRSLLIPFLKAHNRDEVETFFYSDAEPGDVPDSIRNVADVFRDVKKLSDESLAELVKEDKIDILMELNGHCIVNRYGVIVRKSAPIQLTYYNHCASTGITEFDYSLVGDEYRFSEDAYAEKLYFLKGVTGIAVFPEDFPPCAPVPCLTKEEVVFGSFGAAHKVNAEVVKLWCDVLKAVPTAQFYMKAAVLDHAAYIDVYKKMFQDYGIDISRVRLEGYSEHQKMLECYADVDIALDTFPHAAGTTTMEALWQGVPVITLNGEGYAAQNGQVILNSIGHPELIAHSKEEFVLKAKALAINKPQLEKYRKTLREDFRNSPRGNAQTFAEKFEVAYRDMWRLYCSKESL